MSHTPKRHKSPHGTCGRQVSKPTTNCDVSPNHLRHGRIGKSANNCNEQYSKLGRMSLTPERDKSPDRT